MSVKIVRISTKEIEAIIQLKDDCEPMIGGGDDDADRRWSEYVNFINRFLERNNLDQSLKT